MKSSGAIYLIVRCVLDRITMIAGKDREDKHTEYDQGL